MALVDLRIYRIITITVMKIDKNQFTIDIILIKYLMMLKEVRKRGLDEG